MSTAKATVLLVMVATLFPLPAKANGFTFTAAELKEITRMSRTDACRVRCEFSELELVRMEASFLREGHQLYLARGTTAPEYCGNRICAGAVLWQDETMEVMEVLAGTAFSNVTGRALDQAERMAGRVLCHERGQCRVAETAEKSAREGARPGEYANPHGVAVIVGNREYRNERVPEAAYAHRDAEAFRRFVLDVLGFDPDNVIDLRDATQAEMEGAFGNERTHEGRVWRYLHPRHGSDVVVYYSGHGVPGLDDRRGYLLPVDADPNSAKINGYPIDLLYANLGKLEAAKSVRLYLDACFSGESDRGMLIRSASPVYVQAALPAASADKLTVLAAASGAELASWDDEAEHGLFTHHLLDALYGAGDADGDGRVTATEAKTYLDDTMTIAARRNFGRHQNVSLNGVVGAVLVRAQSGGEFPRRPSLDEKRREVGERFRDCEWCPEVVVVPPGSFMMGSPPGEDGRRRWHDDDEEPVHRVTIEKLFAVGVYEVTRGEWGRFVSETGHSTGGSCWRFSSMGSADTRLYNRSGRDWRDPGFEQSDAHPAVCVTWKDAQAFVDWLSMETGRTYRLLSESEWEYVARAGTTTSRYWGGTEAGQCEHANGADRASASSLPYHRSGASCDDSHVHTSPVGSFRPNGNGLHDALGNVWEWVEDCSHGSYFGAPADGSAWTSGSNCGSRVTRGGSWASYPDGLRSADRDRFLAGNRYDIVGFRVARTLD